MLVSPDTFAAVIVGALRLGEKAHQAYLSGEIAKERNFTMFLPTMPVADSKTLETRGAWAENWCCEALRVSEAWRPGGACHGVFVLNSKNELVMNRGKPQIADARMFELELERMILNTPNAPKEVRSSIINYHRELWADSTNGSPWGQFFREFVDVGFKTLAIQPGMLGIGGNIEKFLIQLGPNLAACFDADPSAQKDSSLATQLAKTFAHAALKTVVDNPALVSSDKRWQPMISGVLAPLQEQVLKDGVAVFAEDNIRRMLAGPMAHGLLTAVNSNIDQFLKGDLASDKLLGVVARQTLGAAAATGAEGFDVRKLFTDAAAVQVFDATLKVARDRPELFIRGDGEGVVASRKLLTDLSRVLQESPKPFRGNAELAATLATVSVEAVGAFAVTQLKAMPAASAQGALQIDLAQHLLKSLMDGLQAGLKGDNNALTRVFSRSGAVDVVNLLARHVAKAPHLLLGGGANPQITALAKSIAQAIEADTAGLLGEDNWRTILSMVLDAALANPGSLFSLDPAASATNSIALDVITTLLNAANDSLKGNPPKSGDVLFGETLSRAIEIAIAAASSGVLELARKNGKLVERLAELAKLCERLNNLAKETDPKKIISSMDWLAIFEAYVVELLTKDKPSIANVTDDVLLAVLR